jgi:GABA(A) receptor-associated protein
MSFKEKFTMEQRMHESAIVLKKYPNRIPIILESFGKLIIEKSKYLVPGDITVAQFLIVLRRRIILHSHEGLYLFVNNTLISGNTLLSTIYDKHVDEDLFLYFVVSLENTFG